MWNVILCLQVEEVQCSNCMATWDPTNEPFPAVAFLAFYVDSELVSN